MKQKCVVVEQLTDTENLWHVDFSAELNFFQRQSKIHELFALEFHNFSWLHDVVTVLMCDDVECFARSIQAIDALKLIAAVLSIDVID